MASKINTSKFVYKNFTSVVACKKFYKEQVSNGDECLKLVNSGHTNVVCCLPMKSGKHVMEALASWSPYAKKGDVFVHLTALNEKGADAQFRMLNSLGMITACTQVPGDPNKANPKSWITALDQIRDHVRLNPSCRIIVFRDEFDYGPSVNGTMARVITFIENIPNIKLYQIHVSATDQPITFSANPLIQAWPRVQGIVSPKYCGIQWFKHKKLWHDAEPFFMNENFDLSDQAKDIIRDLYKRDDKVVVVVRLMSSRGDKFEDKKCKEKTILNRIKSLGFTPKLKFFAGDDKFAGTGDWSDSEFIDACESHADWNKSHTKRCQKKKMIIFICASCTRSVEVGFLKYVSSWHDHRNSTNWATMLQSVRTCHYGGYEIHNYFSSPNVKFQHGHCKFDSQKTKSLNHGWVIWTGKGAPPVGNRSRYTVSGNNVKDRCDAILKNSPDGVKYINFDSPNHNWTQSFANVLKKFPNIAKAHKNGPIWLEYSKQVNNNTNVIKFVPAGYPVSTQIHIETKTNCVYG